MGPWGRHVWLYLEETGTHHDVEAPLGVRDWKALPFYQRARVRREL